MRFLLTLPLLAVLVPALAAVDIARGERIHAEKCVACHAERFNGDGAQIYLRKDRIIHNRSELRQRVAMCNAMTNAAMLPDEEDDVAAFLAQRYYKFK
ncbi:MAG TPA: hypothetical protein VMC81_11885 [Rhodocyclaceae bacterium]|nr:hypothetical protein [Rhodocyclaceae bacterium]